MKPKSAVTAALTSAPSLRSEEHTSELQSQSNLVCRLLLEKKKDYKIQCHRLPPNSPQLLYARQSATFTPLIILTIELHSSPCRSAERISSSAISISDDAN